MTPLSQIAWPDAMFEPEQQEEPPLKVSELEGLGILSNSIDSGLLSKYSWLDEQEVAFLLEVHNAGEEGLHKRTVAERVKKNSVLLIRLEAAGFMSGSGIIADGLFFLTITWKGQELGDALVRKARAEGHRTKALREREARIKDVFPQEKTNN